MKLENYYEEIMIGLFRLIKKLKKITLKTVINTLSIVLSFGNSTGLPVIVTTPLTIKAF